MILKILAYIYSELLFDRICVSVDIFCIVVVVVVVVVIFNTYRFTDNIIRFYCDIILIDWVLFM